MTRPIRTIDRARRVGMIGLAVIISGCASPELDPGVVDVTSVSEIPGTEACATGELDGDVNLYMREGSIDPAILDAFEATHEVEVLTDTFASETAVEPKLRSGAAYDVVAAPSIIVDDLVGEELISEIEQPLVPNSGDIHPFFISTPSDPSGDHSAPFRWGTLGVAANPDFADSEAGWGILFEADRIRSYPNGVSLLDDSRATMAAALMYLGYSPNTGDEARLAEAADVITEALDAGATLDSSSYVAALETGQVEVALGLSDALTGRSDGIDFVIPEGGGAVWIDALMIPSAADHPCSAHMFIDFMLDGDQGPALTRWNRYASTRVGAASYVEGEKPGAGGSARVSNPDASFEILSDSDRLARLHERYFAVARG